MFVFSHVRVVFIWVTSLTPVFHTGSLRADPVRESIAGEENVIRRQKKWCGASLRGSSFLTTRWSTFGHRAPPIVTERNLQISLLLGAGVAPPLGLYEKSKNMWTWGIFNTEFRYQNL